MIKIHLTPDEVHLAASHAILRRHKKYSCNRQDREQNQRSSYDDEVMGATAELAICKYKNIFWSGATGIKAKDGGKQIEVRWTHHEGYGGLIVYSNDDDNSIFVLCDGYAPTINIIGWLRGKDAKNKAKPLGKIMLVKRNQLNKFE